MSLCLMKTIGFRDYSPVGAESKSHWNSDFDDWQAMVIVHSVDQ